MKYLITLKSAMLYTLVLGFLSACTNNTNTRDISANDLANQLGNSKIFILDVRTPQEYAAGHVPGAINIAHTSVASKIKTETLQELKNETIVIYCKSGRRASMAEQTLASAGFKKLLHLDGDMDGWQKGNYPIEKYTHDKPVI